MPAVPIGTTGKNFRNLTPFLRFLRRKMTNFVFFLKKLKKLTFIIKKSDACGADRRRRWKIFEICHIFVHFKTIFSLSFPTSLL